MRRRGWRPALLGLAIALVAGLAMPGAAKPSGVTLGPTIRVQTPGSNPTTCPVEGEPTVAVTSAGTWVAYNDDQGCPLNPVAHPHLPSGHLIPGPGGQKYERVHAAGDGDLSGEPALAPHPNHPGSVLLAKHDPLQSGNLIVPTYRINPQLTATSLKRPHVTGPF